MNAEIQRRVAIVIRLVDLSALVVYAIHCMVAACDFNMSERYALVYNTLQEIHTTL